MELKYQSRGSDRLRKTDINLYTLLAKTRLTHEHFMNEMQTTINSQRCYCLYYAIVYTINSQIVVSLSVCLHCDGLGTGMNLCVCLHCGGPGTGMILCVCLHCGGPGTGMNLCVCLHCGGPGTGMILYVCIVVVQELV